MSVDGRDEASRSRGEGKPRGSLLARLRRWSARLIGRRRQDVKPSDPWLLEILDTMPHFVSIADAEGKVMHINRAGRAIAGIDADGPVSQLRVADFQAPHRGELRTEESIANAVRDGRWAGRSTLARRDGSKIPVEQVITAKMNDAGRLERLAIVMHEARSRQEPEFPVPDDRSNFQLLVEAMNAGLMVIDSEERLVFVNPRAANMLGYEPADLLDLPVVDLVDPRFVELHRAQMRQRRAGVQEAYDTSLVGKDGRAAEVRIWPSPILAENGAFAGSLAVITDISARVRMVASLRASQEDLKRLSGQLVSLQEKERQRLALDLHDGIGQSLSAIKYGLDHVTQTLGPQTIAESVESLQAMTGAVRNAIAEVRQLAMALRPSTLDDLGLLATLSWHFREFESIHRGIAVVREIRIAEGDVPERLKTTLYRIVQEALNNVAKHARADRVRVGLARVGDRISLLVADNGCGFDTGAVSPRGGTGMGLAGMNDRALVSGGTYSVRSAPGRGTRILVIWPVAGD